MASKIRTRYAPSPTGIPHIGNIRSALFAWLFARHNNGDFIVRIEDTDQARYDADAERAIIDSLNWLGLNQDEGPDVGGKYGPYHQSKRLDLYHEAAKRLVTNGHAYYCYCSSERLGQVRKAQQARKEPPGYDNHCRDMNFGPNGNFNGFEGSTGNEVIRFKMPLEGITTAQDNIRGEIAWENQLLDDFVMLKSDGFPTYHLASVVDDHAMEISHVLRGDEWLASLPRHWQIYNALEYEKPVFAHLPIILGDDKSKLSKRHGAASVFEYKDQGFLVEAMINFLALLGWSLDDHTELFSLPELIDSFTIERIGSSPAIFNVDKLEWFNGMYIRQLSNHDFIEKLSSFWQTDETPSKFSLSQLDKITPLVQERTKKLDEVWNQISFFEGDIEYPVIRLWSGMGDKKAQRAEREDTRIEIPENAPEVRNWLSVSLNTLEQMNEWEDEEMEESLRLVASDLGTKPRQLFGALRVAITGSTVSPPLFPSMKILGREKSLERIAKSIALLD